MPLVSPRLQQRVGLGSSSSGNLCGSIFLPGRLLQPTRRPCARIVRFRRPRKSIFSRPARFDVVHRPLRDDFVLPLTRCSGNVFVQRLISDHDRGSVCTDVAGKALRSSCARSNSSRTSGSPSYSFRVSSLFSSALLERDAQLIGHHRRRSASTRKIGIASARPTSLDRRARRQRAKRANLCDVGFAILVLDVLDHLARVRSLQKSISISGASNRLSSRNRSNSRS